MKPKKDYQDQQNNLPDTEASGVDDSRRKFNKAGIIAPVLLTLSSRPVWAFECGVSGSMSGNLSSGCTPPARGFTASQFSAAAAWPSPYVKQTTTFDSVFGVSAGGSLFGVAATLLDVLNGAAVTLADTNLQTALKYTDSTANLKTALSAYAVQSIVCTLNDAIFPAYAYPGAGTFYSAISGASTSYDSKVSSATLTNSITKATQKLAALTT